MTDVYYDYVYDGFIEIRNLFALNRGKCVCFSLFNLLKSFE